MAWHFDETSGHYVTFGDAAALTLPDGDWTIAGWIKLDDNTGSNYQYFLSWGGFGASPSLNWYFHEASVADPNVLKFFIEDASGDPGSTITSTGTPGTSTAWQHLAAVRSGNTVTQYVNGVADGTFTNAAFGGVNVAASMYLGMRSDNDPDRRFGGSMAEWAKWDRALAVGERAALVAGFSPRMMPYNLKWHTRMLGGWDEWYGGLTVTNNNSTLADHPPMIYPNSGIVVPWIAAAPPVGNRRRRLLLAG